MPTANSQTNVKLRRALWLAFQVSRPMGMGFLHSEAASKQTEESLYKAVNPANEDSFYADYVFGRMMKTRFSFEDGVLKINPENPQHDYQSWCGKYMTAADLVKATEESLK
jgi:hypothetical protein